jgi:5-methylcytosine-specific restriction endonuclease McrA
MAAAAYNTRAYRAARRDLTRNPTGCVYCGRPATTLDHVPALITHAHVDGSGCCELYPACTRCNYRRGQRLGVRRGRLRRQMRTAVREANASRVW